jgi:ORF6N domain
MNREIIPIRLIAQSIYLIRGQRVMLSRDLAVLYGVAVKVLNQAVKRNAMRFPADFVFQLKAEELANLKSQFVTSSWGGPRRASPYAFTEQGVAMLSSVLKSERAVKVNITIMRAFVKLRETLETNREFARKFSELERRVGKHDKEIAAIIDAIRQLMAPPEKPKREIGFHVREQATRYRTRK